MIKHENGIVNLLEKYFIKYRFTIYLNKNLIISGAFGFISSLFVAFISAKYSNDHISISVLTIMAGFIVYKVVFIILFHHDNKKKYTKKLTGKLNLYVLKQIIIKMIVASSAFDVVNNLSRFFILIELLKDHYHPIPATLISSIISSSFSYLVINLIMKYINVFDSKKKKLF
jgi:hypothetical protein